MLGGVTAPPNTSLVLVDGRAEGAAATGEGPAAVGTAALVTGEAAGAEPVGGADVWLHASIIKATEARSTTLRMGRRFVMASPQTNSVEGSRITVARSSRKRA